jgi:uncharacterized membrane protein (UPF0127 family)
MIEIKARKLTSLTEKSIGLLKNKEPEAVYFKTRWGIHTFFMKFPIDILILDRKGRVVTIWKQMKPNRVFLWNPLYDTVLELPAGTIENKKIKPGEIINLIKTS